MRVPAGVRECVLASLILVGTGGLAAAGPCTANKLSSYSRLAKVVAEAREHTPGTLLATWLLRPRNSSECRFVFRVDMLLDDGRVMSMNFDAATLDPVEIDDERGWVDVGDADDGPGGGTGAGQAAGSGGPSGQGTSGDDDSSKSGVSSSGSGSGGGDDGGDHGGGDHGGGDHGGGGDDGGDSGGGSGGDSGGGGSGGGDDGGGDDGGGSGGGSDGGDD